MKTILSNKVRTKLKTSRFSGPYTSFSNAWFRQRWPWDIYFCIIYQVGPLTNIFQKSKDKDPPRSQIKHAWFSKCLPSCNKSAHTVVIMPEILRQSDRAINVVTAKFTGQSKKGQNSNYQWTKETISNKKDIVKEVWGKKRERTLKNWTNARAGSPFWSD